MVFAPASLEVAREYELDVLADRRAEVFKALGTRRQSPVKLMATQAIPALKSLREGMLPRATKADMLRLGADAAVDAEGEIVLLHVASSADDRRAPADLIAALSE